MELETFCFCDHKVIIFRKEKNRLTAQANRKRSKEYVQNLEKRNAFLELQNKTLLKEIKRLKELYKQDIEEKK